MQETVSNVDYLSIFSNQGFGRLWSLAFDNLTNHPHILAILLFVLIHEIVHLAWFDHAEDPSTGLSAIALSQPKRRWFNGSKRLT